MEPKKRWDGYVSFSYLEPGVDYRAFELSPQLGRVEPFVYPLSNEDERAPSGSSESASASPSTTTAGSRRRTW